MEKLSSDLLVRCFLYLPLRDLLAVCSTCRRIKAVGEDSRLWVNLMERLCGSAYRQPHAGPVVLVRNNAKLTFVAMYSAERAQSLVYQAPCSSPQFVDTSCPRPDSNNRRSVFITASPKLSRTTSQERRLLLVHSRGDLSDPEPTVSQDIGSKNLSMSPSVPPGSSPKSPTAIVSLMPPPSTPPPIPPSIVTPPPLLPRSKVPFEEPLKTSVSSMEIPASGHSQIFQLMLPPSEPPPVPSPIRTGSPPTAPPSKRAQTETTNMIIPPPPKNPPPIPSILKEGADGKTRDRESKHKKVICAGSVIFNHIKSRMTSLQKPKRGRFQMTSQK
ncbi:hypothetical protein Pelo_4302 [Pelomyxa schiedti]|nr:hypothetical protein Pelo_4302 [Pelomyxa schiedti]